MIMMIKTNSLKNNRKLLIELILIIFLLIVLVILFVPKAYANYKHKQYMEKYFSAKEDTKPLKPLWTKDGGKEFTYKFNVDEYDCEYIITAPKGHDDIVYSSTLDGKEQGCSVLVTYGQHIPGRKLRDYPDTITGIKTSDINFDGYTDIIMTGTIKSKENLWVFFGEEQYDSQEELEYEIFLNDEGIDSLIENTLGSNYTVEDIEDYFVGKTQNGKFKNYIDAYRKVINFYECTQPEARKYKLVYFDEDDIPELVVDNSGYMVSMYTFYDGDVYAPIVDWPYGAFGNVGYDYKVKGNLISNFDQDGAGAIGTYRGFGIIDGKIEELYYHSFYNLSDQEDEWWFNEKLTKEQREALEVKSEDTKYDSLHGVYPAREILKQLDIPSFTVESISGNLSVFNVADKEFHYQVEKLKDNKKCFWLANDASASQKTLKCDSYKTYLISRENDKAYLYLSVNYKGKSTLYIYNLNTKTVNSPIKFEKYSLNSKEITNPNSFTMETIMKDIGNFKVKKEFFVGENGLPNEKDEFNYFIKTNTKEDSNNDYGDVLILLKDFTCSATKNLTKDYIYYSEDYPDDDELVSFKKGTKFYLYKCRDVYGFGELYWKDYYIVSDDGYMIDLHLDIDDNGNLNLDNSVISEGDDNLFLADFKIE